MNLVLPGNNKSLGLGLPQFLQFLVRPFKLIYVQIGSITTDNAANFAKTFKVYGIDVDDPIAENDEDTLNYKDESNVQHVNLTELLQDGTDISLSTHYRCAAHTLNLLATVDVKKVPGWTIGSHQLRPCFTKVPVFLLYILISYHRSCFHTFKC